MAILMLGVCATLVPLSAAPAVSAATAVEVDAHEALRKLPKNKWYDRQEDAYSPPRGTTADRAGDNELRKTGWLAKAKATQQPGASRRGMWNWRAAYSEWISTAIITGLGLVLLAIVALLAWHSLRSYMPARYQQPTTSPGVTIDPARVTDLPFEVSATGTSPLAYADELQRAGRYDEAIIWVFAYLLLALDNGRYIHLQKGKTNRMYLREIRKHPDLANMIEPYMHAFEDVFFGKHPISKQRFMELWEKLDAFHARWQPAVRRATSGLPTRTASA